MKEITLEKFRQGYHTIAELVVSLDNDYKAILKPWNEIKIYLESKPTENQADIMEELISLCDIGAVSDSYLSDYKIEYGTKISFEDYLKIKLKTVNKKIEFNQFMQDDRVIHLKNKLKGINGKSEKINFLLDKKKELEGDHPEALGDILKKDEVYLFIKRELKHLGKYNDVGNKTKVTPSQKLKTNLTDIQRASLFDLLVKDGFIPDDTDKNGFIQAFGNNENNFVIHWEKSKSLLAHFVDTFNCEILGNDGDKRRTQWKPFETLFNVNGLRGAKNDYQKTGSLPLGYKQIDTIIKAISNCR